jgi:hypothetical protein
MSTERKRTETAPGVSQASSNGIDAVREYQLKVLSAIHDNVDAMFECANDMLRAKSASEFFELSTKHSQRQLEMMGKQANELVSSVQKLSAQPGIQFGRMS